MSDKNLLKLQENMMTMNEWLNTFLKPREVEEVKTCSLCNNEMQIIETGISYDDVSGRIIKVVKMDCFTKFHGRVTKVVNMNRWLT